ncbi:hypothetical protein Slin15195_G060450 [Septoria linicola]|uniref:Uncharacterized protein n=1 Tax=Septoria linicola TaxID=215465 RepID=A0A9Q9EIF7_9PEZI|nr:hypothetical protein Slin14017_G076290 [Septoria linicola]USW52726.1 hypothetical protein Slin15195_G060450 [Septoria linicola]
MASNNATTAAAADEDMQGVHFGSARDIEITLTTLARTVTAKESALAAAQARIAEQAATIRLQDGDIAEKNRLVQIKEVIIDQQSRRIRDLEGERQVLLEELRKVEDQFSLEWCSLRRWRGGASRCDAHAVQRRELATRSFYQGLMHLH